MLERLPLPFEVRETTDATSLGWADPPVLEMNGESYSGRLQERSPREWVVSW